MPQYNYKFLSGAQLREYARDLERTAARIAEISEWMDKSGVSEMKARNAAIGMRAMDYSKKYADALEEAVLKIKTDQEAYAPADDVQVTVKDGRIEKRASYRTFANTDEAPDESPEDRAKLLAMFEYVMRNIKEKDEEEDEKPAKKKTTAKKKAPRKKTSS